MTREERERLRRLAEAATPGPWVVRNWHDWSSVIHEGASWRAVAGRIGEDLAEPKDGQRSLDAAFIAAARSAVPALLDEVDRLRELLEYVLDCPPCGECVPLIEEALR